MGRPKHDRYCIEHGWSYRQKQCPLCEYEKRIAENCSEVITDKLFEELCLKGHDPAYLTDMRNEGFRYERDTDSFTMYGVL